MHAKINSQPISLSKVATVFCLSVVCYAGACRRKIPPPTVGNDVSIISKVNEIDQRVARLEKAAEISQSLTNNAAALVSRAQTLEHRADVLEKEIGKQDRRIRTLEGIKHGFGN